MHLKRNIFKANICPKIRIIMVKVIVMAGGKIKKNLSDLEKKLTDKYYKDKYLLGKGYKPLKKVRLKRGSKKQPLIYYVLSALEQSPIIDDITIVGEKDRLDRFLEKKKYSKQINTVQQEGSILENALIGYEASNARKHSLFLASDIPKITPFSIRDFLKRCDGEYDAYFPIIGWETGITNKKRPPLKLIDDKHEPDKIYDKHGRRGFRIGNMIYANPNEIGKKEFIDIAYNSRKLLIPKNIWTLYKYISPEVKKYRKKNLSIDDVESKLSKIFDTNFKLIEIYSKEIEEDIDSETDIYNLENGH